MAGQSYDAYRVRQNRPSIEGNEGKKRRKKTSSGRENLHNECLEKTTVKRWKMQKEVNKHPSLPADRPRSLSQKGTKETHTIQSLCF